MPRDRTLDNPVESPEEDEFNRWPFSQRLADTIAKIDARRGAPTIGVYGRWGYGKSTVLNFIRAHLQDDYKNNVEVFEFNPWRFKDQDALASVFFQGLAITVDRTLGGTGQRVGEILEYGSTLLNVIPIAGPAVGKIGEKIGNRLAHQSLEDERKKIIDIMGNSDRKVVVLIDDIDRLDREEILTLLKMVRLTANFPQIVYVLAFDDEMVARVLGQSFGGSQEAGRQFIEKIVQYPFTIPAVGRRRLLTFIEKRAQEACANAEIILGQGDWLELSNIAETCFLPRLVTPRQAIRYGNALAFALPMLKGEVDPRDQILIEGVRTLFPELYVFIRDNSQMFTVQDAPFGPTRARSFATAFGGVPLEVAGFGDVVSRVLGNVDDTQKTAGTALLRALFASGRPKGVSVARYFDRYFSYTVAADDITDAELSKLFKLCADDMQSSANELFCELADRNAFVLLSRVRAIVGGAGRDLTERVAKILAVHGSVFTRETQGIRDSVTAQAATLVAELVLSYPGEMEQRAAFALQVLAWAEPLPFAHMLCEELETASFRNRTTPGEVDFLLPEASPNEMRAALVKRIADAARHQPPYEQFAPSNALKLMTLWRFEDSTGLRTYLRDRITNNHAEAAMVLGLFKKSGFLSFQLLIEMIDIDVLTAVLNNYYGPALAEGNWTQEIALLQSFLSFIEVRSRASSLP